MRRRVLLLWLLFSAALLPGGVSGEPVVPEGGKEVFFELYTLDISGRPATSYIGGHYTYYFTEWLAAGPGLSIPPLDWSFFNLGFFFHAYVFPAPDWFIRPYLYLEAGVQFTDLEYTFTDLGINKPGNLWLWFGFLRPGVGLEAQIYRTSSFVLTARVMVYEHLEFLHLQYFLEPIASLNLSAGLSYAFF